jgi:hypothetical protein
VKRQRVAVVIATITYFVTIAGILIGSVVGLLVLRVFVLWRRFRGRRYVRTITILTIILYVLILGGVVTLCLSRYWLALFLVLLLFADLWLSLLVPREMEAIPPEATEKCDLCGSNLYTAGRPCMVGEHHVCGECYRKIEEQRKQAR